MAIVGTDQDEENPSAAPAAGTPGTGGSANAAPPSTGGAGGGFIGGGTGQGSTTAVKSPTAPTSSGNYTNLTSYLQANQGGGATMGKTAENVVGQTGQQAKNDLATYQGSTNAAIAAGTPGVNQNTLSQIKNGITTGPSTTTKNADGSTTTTGGRETYTGPTPAAVSYTGPTDPSKVTGQAATDQGKAYGDIQALVGGAPGSGTYTGGMVGQAAGGQTGVQSLLKSTYQQPSYTAGESGLDAFLTGGTPGGQQSLKNIQDQWGGMGKTADDANAGLYSNMIKGNGTAQNVNTTYAGAVKAAQDQAAAYNPASLTTSAPQTATTAPQTTKPVAATNSQVAGAAAASLAKETAARNAALAGGAAAATKSGKAGSVLGAPLPPKVPTVSAGQVAINPSAQPSGPAINPAQLNSPPNLAVAPSGVGTYAPGQVALNFAHGGRVPSYDEILKAVGRGKR